MSELRNDEQPPVQQDNVSDPGSVIKLVFAWIFVGVPALWGIWQVFVKSLDLFK